ncbi:MAG: mreD [Rhodospirillales bacterium]|nr:mreD [Rhodospirillales bacterium]
MTPTTVWHRLDQTARALVPGLTLLLATLLSLLPLGLPGWGQVTPPFALMAVFWWSIHRPASVPPSIAFGIGLLQDLASGAPIGQSALLLVLTRWIILGQRRFLAPQPFVLLWGSFALVAVAAATVEWVCYALLTVRIPPIEAGLTRAALGIALFPIVVRLALLPAQRFANDGVVS